MRPNLARAAAAVILLLVVFGPVSLSSRAFTSGPPWGNTNAPGDGNCTGCHDTFLLDSGTAGFAITAPVTYVPSSAELVGVGFTGSTSTKHGFQITAQDGAGNPAGSWAAVLSGKTKNVTGHPEYHEHTSSGTALSAWTMNWMAPLSLPPGPVTFYACGADTNNNGSTSGDHIYSATRKLYQATLSTPGTSWAIGSSMTLTLSVPGHGGEVYFIVPSNDPTPFSLGDPFVLEVTPNEILDLVAQLPQIFQNMSSNLDASGQATATVNVPNHPPLIGLPFHFAGVTATAALSPTEVSNRVTITFQ